MNRIFIYFSILLIACFISSCKSTSKPEEFISTTMNLKVFADNGEATISAVKKNKDADEDITANINSETGAYLHFGDIVELTVKPVVADKAILWTGGNIKDSDRHNRTIQIIIEEDTTVTVFIGTSASPVDSFYLDLLMSDNGTVYVNNDKHTSSSKIMFAKGQTISLKAVANNSYYFVSWDINDGTSSQSNEHIIVMDKAKTLIASFKSNSVGIKLKLRIKDGSVSINNVNYTEDTEVFFAKNTSLNIIATANTEDTENGFIGWGGDVRNIDNTKKTISLSIISNMFLEPIFGKKQGRLYLSFNPPTNDFLSITYRTGSGLGILSAGNNFTDPLSPGDVVILTADSSAPPSGYKATPTWAGAGGYGVADKTTVSFNGNSVVTSVMFEPIKYTFIVETEKYVDGQNLNSNDPVGGYTITVDGITYNNMSYISRRFDANSVINVSLNTGIHFTNMSFNNTQDTNVEYPLAENNSKLTIKLGHISKEISLNIIGGKRVIETKDYISSIKIDNSGYATSDISYASDNDDNITTTTTIKVLSGYNVIFTANPSGGHAFAEYEGLDKANGNVGYFNASWDKTIAAKFNSSDVWDGSLMTEVPDVANVYTVNVPSELAWIANTSSGDTFLGKTVDIKLDLDMNNKPFAGIATGDIQSSFEGTLKGNGKKIKNVYISGGKHIGFIGKLGEKGVVDGVFISSGDISISGGYSVGGIVGSNYKGKIINSSNNAAINASQGRYAGGIAGFNNAGLIENSFNYGSIKGLTSVGGIVGFNDRGTNTNVGNEGKIIAREGGNGNYFGGIAGNNLSGNISLAYNMGVMKITNSSYVGGIVGENKGIGSMIRSVYNKAELEIATTADTKSEYLGGIIGYDSGTETPGNLSDICFRDAYNTGAIRGYYSVGGIVGTAIDTSKWAYIYNIGNVSSRVIANKAGAIIGEARTTIEMQSVWYLKTGSANYNLDTAGKLFDNAAAVATSIIAPDNVTTTHMGLPPSDRVWEDRTPVRQINGVKKYPMIINLGEYTESKP